VALRIDAENGLHALLVLRRELERDVGIILGRVAVHEEIFAGPGTAGGDCPDVGALQVIAISLMLLFSWHKLYNQGGHRQARCPFWPI